MFVYLKLTGTINWSWWWVTAPFWAPFPVTLTLLVLLSIGIFFFGSDKTKKKFALWLQS